MTNIWKFSIESNRHDIEAFEVICSWFCKKILFDIRISHTFKTFHDDNDENVEADIRFYIKDFWTILEFEAKEKNYIDWVFLERFKKRKRWIMINFFKKSFDHEMKLFKKSKTSSIISRLLQKIRSNLINIAVLRRRNTNNFCLQTLLKIIEKKNYIAIFRSQHMYIEFRMIDIKTNAIWNSIALYSIQNHDMLRRRNQMIEISAFQILCLISSFFATLFSDLASSKSTWRSIIKNVVCQCSWCAVCTSMNNHIWFSLI